MAFLDVKKAFDTVWHDGLLLKLSSFGFPRYIWTIVHNLYRRSTSSVLWNSTISRSFKLRQGVRQGAILSPLLYSIFVDDLLHQLSCSNLGTSINGCYCGSPMFADDLALIADSPEELQSMINIVHNYSTAWRYHLNAHKSAILVIGESPASRACLHPSRQWLIGNDTIPEKDSYHHLGILRSVTSSSLPRISEHCSSCRSAFFSLNIIGPRAGCLHPLTSLRLYKAFCIPILLYGCELWSPTQTELILLERTHRKILRTTSGMPIRCKSIALQQSLGTINIQNMIRQRQLTFIQTFARLPQNSLPRQILDSRISSASSQRSVISTWRSLSESLHLPSIQTILNGHLSKAQWKNQVKRTIHSAVFPSFADDCDHIPLANYLPSRMGKPYPHWSVTIGFPSLTKKNISRLKLLLNCSGLEADVCRFRSLTSTSNVYKLCKSGPEDAKHVISHCSVLAPARDAFDLPPPLASARASDPVQFAALVLGTDWINDVCVQHACIDFVHHLLSAREQLLQSFFLYFRPNLGLLSFSGGYKEEEEEEGSWPRLAL